MGKTYPKAQDNEDPSRSENSFHSLRRCIKINDEGCAAKDPDAGMITVSYDEIDPLDLVYHPATPPEKRSVQEILTEVDEAALRVIIRHEPDSEFWFDDVVSVGECSTAIGDLALQIMIYVLRAKRLADQGDTTHLAPLLFEIGSLYQQMRFLPFDHHAKAGLKVHKASSDGGKQTSQKDKEKHTLYQLDLRAYLADPRNRRVSLTGARQKIADKYGVCLRTVQRNTKGISR